jgi:hypothetical protein
MIYTPYRTICECMTGTASVPITYLSPSPSEHLIVYPPKSILTGIADSETVRGVEYGGNVFEPQGFIFVVIQFVDLKPESRHYLLRMPVEDGS